ncbi:hypothetical protein [Pseudarthrobacter sp. S6]|uniref:hypothetical protein n=1 Tax=Pseudarthrobacter sp. S6 TaxID=3418420 RepID=UPI003CF1BB92
MGDHSAESTQAAYPNRAALRTAVQTFFPAVIGLLGILPLVLQAILDGFGRHLPPDIYGLLAGAVVVITAASATIARVAAIPGVIAWTRDYLPFLAPDK